MLTERLIRIAIANAFLDKDQFRSPTHDSRRNLRYVEPVMQAYLDGRGPQDDPLFDEFYLRHVARMIERAVDIEPDPTRVAVQAYFQAWSLWAAWSLRAAMEI
jgi:hypothetical protein